MPLRLRSALYPLIGERIHGAIGHAVDIFAVLGTIFGVATSLGTVGGSPVMMPKVQIGNPNAIVRYASESSVDAVGRYGSAHHDPATTASVRTAIAAVVTAGRLRLGAHWPTDMIAGAVIGLFWLAWNILAIERGGRPAAQGLDGPGQGLAVVRPLKELLHEVLGMAGKRLGATTKVKGFTKHDTSVLSRKFVALRCARRRIGCEPPRRRRCS